MSNVRELPRQTAVHEEASAWIARIDRGLSGAEQAELDEWLARNPEHERDLMRMAKLWDRMDVLARLADVCPVRPRTSSRVPRLLTAMAASIALAAGVLAWFSLGGLPGDRTQERVASQANVYRTEIGNQASYTLADGTRMSLNTDTVVRVSYTEFNRLLTLERGEMHLVVAHERDRPLSVIVGGKIVQAVGTEFNVEITSDKRIELVVTEGVVMVGVVDRNVGEIEAGRPIALTQSSPLVAAGEAAYIDDDTDDLDDIRTETIRPEDIAVKLSWREGNVIFRGESLEEALAEIERYTAVEFVFLDEASKKVRIAGLFKAGDVDGLLAALRQNFNITYERVGDDKVLLSGE